MDDLITMTQAAQRMGCSRVWVYQLIKSGRLKAKLVGGIYILKQKDIEACKVRHREKPDTNGHNSTLPQKRSSSTKVPSKTKAAKTGSRKRSR